MLALAWLAADTGFILVVALPGLRLLRILPRVDWSVMCCENGFWHTGWKVASLLHVYLNTLMFGLMVVWSLTILLLLVLLGWCICSMFLGLVGFVVGGGMWTCCPMMMSLLLNGVLRTLLCLLLCKLFSELRCGGDLGATSAWPLITSALTT